MSKILNIITSTDIENLIIFNSKKIRYIDVNIKGDFYNYIDDKDVAFIKKINSLNDFNNSQKMKIFHETLKIISSLLFNKYIQYKNIETSFTNILELSYNFTELYEEDFFQDILNKINLTQVYEIKEIIEQLYVDIVCLVSRKNSGIEYTPKSIVNLMLDIVNYKGNNILNTKLLEPACGSGIFLTEAINRFFEASNIKDINQIKKILLEDTLITAYDINPMNVYLSKLLIILEIIDNCKNISLSDIYDLFEKLPITVQNALKINTNDYFDYIVGNPPYIRLQNMNIEERQYIKDNYLSATGRFDLYVCFIEKSINLLKDGGKLSFITSNKYLTSNYGKGIRNFIRYNFEINLMFDLNDTKFFQAAVLPSIISGTKTINPVNDNISYFHIKQDNSEQYIYKEADIFQLILDLKNTNTSYKDFFKINNKRKDLFIEFAYSKEKLPALDEQWNFGAKDDIEIKQYIESQDTVLLKEIAEVCVGIKTTADNVFVKPMTKQFIESQALEQDLLYPLIQSRNVDKWQINWDINNSDDRFILYPHEVKNSKMVAVDLDFYPNVKKYIYSHEEQLKSRKYLMKSNIRKWYECWVPQHLSKFKHPKIVTSDIVSTNSFALDFEGRLCQGNTFFIILKSNFSIPQNLDANQFLKYLIGILNSEVMEFYQKSISGSLYSKKYRYTSTNLNRWVIPKVSLSNINYIKKIISTVDNLTNSTNQDKKIFESELNDLVYKLYNLSNEYIINIKNFLKTNR